MNDISRQPKRPNSSQTNPLNFYPKTKSNCNIQIYTNFLISCPYRAECTKLAKVTSNTSHDSVNRFLNNSSFQFKQMFDEVKQIIKMNLNGGYLSVDDTILDKPYSLLENCELINRHYSGKHKMPVKGICLITLFYTDPSGKTSPVNFRLFTNGVKSKNEHFRDMVEEVKGWGLKAKFMTSDCFYATKENLLKWRLENYCLCNNISSTNIVEYGEICRDKKLKRNEIDRNKESNDNNQNNNRPNIKEPAYGEFINGSTRCRVKDLDIPKNGIIVEYAGAGLVKIFKLRPRLGTEYLYSMVKLRSIEEMDKLTKADFKKLNSKHWNIELYHRTLKSFCAIEKFMVRSVKAITNHIFCSLRAFVILTYNKLKKVLKSVGDLRMRLYNGLCEQFIFANSSKPSEQQNPPILTFQLGIEHHPPNYLKNMA